MTMLLLLLLALQLKQHDENPSYWSKIFGNRYVQLVLVAIGTALEEWQRNKQ